MLRGELFVKSLGDKARIYFMQRGKDKESENVPVKLYRRSSDEINFSSGLVGDKFGKWYEYIDNLKHTAEDVTVIFEGVLPMVHSYCEYIDEDVETGHTYTYWVEANAFDEHIVLGPTACKIRDRDIWWSYDRTLEEMEHLCAANPKLIEMKQYGETTKHRPLFGMNIGNKNRVIALAGAIHASEPGPELLLKALAFIIKERPELLNNVGIALMPTVNADMREETVDGVPNYLRKNPNGVDLNRNFDNNWCVEYVYGFSNDMPESVTYHGPYPESENETKAAVNFVNDNKPLAMFVYDSCSVITEERFLCSGGPEDGELYTFENELAALYSKEFRINRPGCGDSFTAPFLTYPYQSPAFKTTGKPKGTFEGWAYHTYNIPSYSLQSAHSEEGKGNDDDNVSLELLERWSIRHAHAIIAVLEKFSE